MAELPAEALTRLGEQIFGSDWAAPMSRLTGINARTLLRIKSAAADQRDYPPALDALIRLEVAMASASREVSRAVAKAKL